MFFKISKKLNNRLFYFFLFLVIWSITCCCFAQADSTGVDFSPSQASGEMNFGKVLLRTILSLSFVILLLVLFIAGIKWLQNRTQTGYSKLKSMSIQETITLGPKKQLFLVTVLDRVLLIGASENNMSLILEMTEDEKKKISMKKTGKQHSFSRTLANQIAKISGVQKD